MVSSFGCLLDSLLSTFFETDFSDVPSESATKGLGSSLVSGINIWSYKSD